MSNKIALITGGSRGIGKSAALNLAKAGVDVILTFNSRQADAEQVVGEIEDLGRNAVALQLDVGNVGSFAAFAAAVKQALQQQWRRGSFDYLVNNAGMGANALIAETTEAQFDELMNVHFKGVFFLTQRLLPLIADNGGILNISSGLSRFSIPGYAAYASMKGAIDVFTRYLAKELGSRGVTANVLAPGGVETDFGGGALRDNKELNQYVASQTALGRVGLPDDIGGVIASLLSERNRWINAQRVEATGGMFI